MAPGMSSLQASHLLRLSEVITRESKLLYRYLAANKLAQPSFSVDGPDRGIMILEDEPKRAKLEHARRQLIAATRELYDLSMGPRESVRSLALDVSFPIMSCVRVATASMPRSQTGC